MISYWEQESFVNYDYIICGGGIVGLSTAVSLKEKSPEARVLVLEKGILPSGASTKNAGFACFGSLTELIDDLNHLTENEVLALVKKRWDGLQLLRSRLGDKNIEFLLTGGYELLKDENMQALDHLERINFMLQDLFDEPVYQLRNDLISTFGFSDLYKGLILNPYEGMIDTGKMMRGLLNKAKQHGVDVITGAEVDRITPGKKVRVHLSNPQQLVFNASKVACCTNAFTTRFFPGLDIKPGRGIVLITKPIDNLKFKGVFHIEEGYYYFRNIGNRVLYGGGRNLDFDGETTTDFSINKKIMSRLTKDLDSDILPGISYEVDHTWAGIMAFGKTKEPILKQVDENVFAGVRLGGMGVAIGSLLGEDLAQLML